MPLAPDPFTQHVESVCQKIERQKHAIKGNRMDLRGTGMDPLETFLSDIRQWAPSAYPEACELACTDDSVQTLLRNTLKETSAHSLQTGAHISGVTLLAERAAQSLIENKTLAPRQGAELIIAAALHDWGKLTTPGNILDSPERLEGERREIMNHHVIASLQMADQILPVWMRNIINTIGQHHENLDGSGYPLGLTAEKLSTTSRIIRILDMFEAGTAQRSYKAALPPEKMIKIMRREADAGKMDAPLLDALAPTLRRFGWEREKNRAFANAPATSVQLVTALSESEARPLGVWADRVKATALQSVATGPWGHLATAQKTPGPLVLVPG